MNARSFLLVLSSTILASGCAEYIPAPPVTVPVQGKVILPNGSPMSMGRVTFVPKDQTKGMETFAELNKDGTFKNGQPGVVPASYKITIDPTSYREGRPRAIHKGAVPKTYQGKETTPLEYEISQSNNTFEIRLK